MVTKLHCYIKINQRGIIQKRNKVELRFLCTALWVIAKNMHTKFGMIWTYSDSYAPDKEMRTPPPPPTKVIHMSPSQATQKGRQLKTNCTVGYKPGQGHFISSSSIYSTWSFKQIPVQHLKIMCDIRTYLGMGTYGSAYIIFFGSGKSEDLHFEWECVLSFGLQWPGLLLLLQCTPEQQNRHRQL